MPKRWLSRHKKTLIRSQLNSIAATVVDFGVLYCLVEFFKIYYVFGVSIGAFCGAVLNYTLNRIWGFDHDGERVKTQASRYATVALGSLLLNTFFVFVLTESLQISYLISKVITAILVGFFWNYLLHRYYVFRKKLL